MTALAKLRSLDDLLIVASLPDTSTAWLSTPLRPHDVKISTVRKSVDGHRIIIEPVNESLIRLQKKLKEFLDRKVLDPHPDVHGFTRNRGPYTNAQAHLDAAALLTVDISDFFPTISSLQINATLVEHGATAEIANGITNVSTFQNTLATGFSTSPVLSNLFFRPLDEELASLAKYYELTYTRYADDLTFSGASVTDEHLLHVAGLLTSYGFRVNRKKVRFQRRGHPQMVTGYGVAHSDHPRVAKKFKSTLRQDLYYAGKFGLEAQSRFRSLSEDAFMQRLLGRINYLMESEKSLALCMRKDFKEMVEKEGIKEMSESGKLSQTSKKLLNALGESNSSSAADP